MKETHGFDLSLCVITALVCKLWLTTDIISWTLQIHLSFFTRVCGYVFPIYRAAVSGNDKPQHYLDPFIPYIIRLSTNYFIIMKIMFSQILATRFDRHYQSQAKLLQKYTKESRSDFENSLSHKVFMLIRSITINKMA